MVTPEDIIRVFPPLAPRIALKLIVQHGASREEAVDAVQDVFANLLDRARRGKFPPHIDDDEHLRSYIATAAKHRLIDERRKSGRALSHETVIWCAAAPGNFEEELISAEQSARLRDAVQQLTHPYRVIFELLLDEELSIAEIARRIGSKEGSIYTQYARGLAKLRKALRNRM